MNFYKLCLFIILLVGILLSGCAKRKPSATVPFKAGTGYCDGGVGQFTIGLTRSAQYPGYYTLKIATVSTPYPGYGARVALVTENNNVQELTSITKLNNNRELVSGYVSQFTLDSFQYLVVAKYTGGETNFLDIRSDADAICTLPTVDNSNGEQASQGY